MIITELSSSPDDSEGCVEGEVTEPESQVICDVQNKSLEYYLDDEEENGGFQKSILNSLISTRFGKTDLDSDENLDLDKEESKSEFKVESFVKTFKTLVDIATEPILVESPPISSGNSEASETETFSFIPAIKRISNNFIKSTSIFFKNETADLITLGTNDYEASNEQVIRSELNDEELEYEEIQCVDIGELDENVIETSRNNWSLNELAKWF